MATNPSKTANLTCDQCGFQNEAERVYCHNCGAKLDRSLLPKTPEKKVETPEKARKRVAKMTNPGAGGIGREIKTLFKVGIGSAVLATLILAARKPDDVPEVKKELPTRLLGAEMMEAVESPQARPLSFTEDDVNHYLKQTLKSKEGAIPGVRFERAFVHLSPGVIRISSEQSLWGYSVFSGIAYKLEVANGKFTPTIVGGNFGRVVVPAQVMQYGELAFQQLWAALDRERKQMDKVQAITVEKGRIALVTKGAGR